MSDAAIAECDLPQLNMGATPAVTDRKRISKFSCGFIIYSGYGHYHRLEMLCAMEKVTAQKKTDAYTGVKRRRVY